MPTIISRVKPAGMGLLLIVCMINPWSVTSARAGGTTTTEIGFDTRAYWQEARFPPQDSDVEPSLYIQPQWRWKSDNRRQTVRASVFARWDGQDEERTHADIRELYWAYASGAWDLTLGINKVFWGVTESRHLVDTINQTDGVEDPDGEDKLGQPMLNVNFQQPWGTTGLFVMPYFRERTFPGADGRLRPPLVVDSDNAQYESSSEREHLDLALRYSHYIGDLDIGIHVFDGTSREPRLISLDGVTLTPVYDQMTQSGIDLQWTRGAWLWKLEFIHRKTKLDTFSAAVAGLEYTQYQIRQSSADLGWLVEFLYDGRGPNQPVTVQENDVFIGTRLALNDPSDTSLLAGAQFDTKTDEIFINMEAERRLSEHFTAELRVRVFTGAKNTDPTYAFARDDYLQLRLGWHY